MQCSNCYDNEDVGFGRTKTVHLELDYAFSKGGFTYYQCPRCGKTKKQEDRFFGGGITQDVSVDEAVQVQGKKSRAGSIIGKAVAVGVIGLLIGAAGSASKE